ncbi:MAG: stage V sporulation protein T [Lachnospiraceae bacterium]|nr:stage V sporulation protein T [Lachnospiraceae bacterium]
MRATGIVRRIDDLGRIVIPKEIRRTLCIRESDPLEIYTDREGEIILKKYSPIGEMGTFAKKYTESLFQTTGLVAAVADRNQIVAISGGMKNLQGKSISPEMEQKLDARETVMATEEDRAFVEVFKDGDGKYHEEIICPIICEGDVIGAVILLASEEKAVMTETEKKLVQTAANFLGKQMEQ